MRCLIRQFLCAALALLGATQFAFAAGGQYGRTTQTIVVKGKTLPPGSYVLVSYDGGDSWITTQYADADKIPKQALAIIPIVDFTPRPSGAVNRETPAYKAFPNVFINPTTLRQEERVPSFRAGEKVTIWSRQGDDYIVRVDKYGTVRVPVSAVTITSGSAENGSVEPIAPIPAGGLTPLPVAQPTKPTEETGSPFTVLWYIIGFVGVIFALGGIWTRYKQIRHKRALADALSPVPHVDYFQRNEDGGFTVRYKKGIMGNTELQVTPDFVIIDREQHNRDTFRHFTRASQGLSGIKLGYFIGNREFTIESSAWSDPAKFDEFLTALNIALQRAPLRGDGDKVSADSLRAVRPTDF